MEATTFLAVSGIEVFSEANLAESTCTTFAVLRTASKWSATRTVLLVLTFDHERGFGAIECEFASVESSGLQRGAQSPRTQQAFWTGLAHPIGIFRFASKVSAPRTLAVHEREGAAKLRRHARWANLTYLLAFAGLKSPNAARCAFGPACERCSAKCTGFTAARASLLAHGSRWAGRACFLTLPRLLMPGRTQLAHHRTGFGLLVARQAWQANVCAFARSVGARLAREAAAAGILSEGWLVLPCRTG